MIHATTEHLQPFTVGTGIKAGVTNATLFNANNMLVAPGDAILTFLDSEPTGTIDYSNTTFSSNVGAGVMPGRGRLRDITQRH